MAVEVVQLVLYLHPATNSGEVEIVVNVVVVSYSVVEVVSYSVVEVVLYSVVVVALYREEVSREVEGEEVTEVKEVECREDVDEVCC